MMNDMNDHLSGLSLPLSPNPTNPLISNPNHPAASINQQNDNNYYHQQQQHRSSHQHPSHSYSHHLHPSPPTSTGMPRVPSVGSMPAKFLGFNDPSDRGLLDLEMQEELFNIFSMASTSFDTDAPGPEFFSPSYHIASSSSQSNNDVASSITGLASPPPSSAAAAVSASSPTSAYTGSIGHLHSQQSSSSSSSANFNPFSSPPAGMAPTPPPNPIATSTSLQANDAYLQSINSNSSAAISSSSSAISSSSSIQQQSHPPAASSNEALMGHNSHTPNSKQPSLQSAASSSSSSSSSHFQHHPPPLQPASSSSPSSSPFLINYTQPSLAAALTGNAPLSAEQQQRLYADFIAGKHLNSFHAQPPLSMPPSAAAAAAAASSSSSYPPAPHLQYQPSLPAISAPNSHLSHSDGSEDSDDDDVGVDGPNGRKRGGRVKLESTPQSAHFHAPYYKPPPMSLPMPMSGVVGMHPNPNAMSGPMGGAMDPNQSQYDQMGGDPNDKERLGKRLARKAELGQTRGGDQIWQANKQPDGLQTVAFRQLIRLCSSTRCLRRLACFSFLLARASRRRKKMYVQDLEAKVKQMGQKLEELQAKASSNRSKAPTAVLIDEDLQRKSAQQTIRATMSAILSQTDTPDAVASQRIQELVRQFVENSRERQAQVETYLDRVQESLTPGLQAKFAMWGLDQNDDFYTKPGLWTSLMSKEIGLTPMQLSAILSKRSAIHQERVNMGQCEVMIKELRAKALQHLRSLHQTMDEIQSVMSPTQLAKFYLWVENNEWTMQMLDLNK